MTMTVEVQGMKRSERDEWTKILRTGEFPDGTPAIQGDGFLDRDGKMCCLGAKCLADVKAERHGIVRKYLHDDDSSNTQMTYGIVDGDFNSHMPTFAIQRAWGLYYLDNDEPRPSFHCGELARLNDAHVPFPEIADWIDANVPVIEG